MNCKFLYISKSIVTVVFILLTSASPTVASDYFPLETGIQWSYTDNVTGSIYSVDQFYGIEATPVAFHWPQFKGTTFWLVDDIAGPMLKGLTFQESWYSAYGWQISWWSIGFNTAVRLFDLPITPGSELMDIVSSDFQEFHFLSRTIGEAENLATPFGDLVVYQVTLQDLSAAFPISRFYINQELGVVGFNGSLLTSVSGIVENENTSWCKIKSLYR